MGFYQPATAPAKSDLTAKNRVWGFFAESVSASLETRRAALETHRENYGECRRTASGIPLWPSRDPIGERGGLKLYGFGPNSPSNGYDYLGADWKDDAKQMAADSLATLQSWFESMVDSGKAKADEAINGYLEKALQEGKLSVSWRRSDKAILWESKKPLDIKVSAKVSYGVNVRSGDEGGEVVRGELFVSGNLSGRFKSNRVPQLAGGKIIVGAGGSLKLSQPYCYNKVTGDAYLQDRKGSLSLGLKGGVRWETGWVGHTWVNDYWATNIFVEGIITATWKWKLPGFEYDGFHVGGYVRGVKAKQQRAPWGNGRWVGETDYFRVGFGDQVDF